MKARDLHTGQNKEKLLFVLYTSKTYGLESIPQKIVSNRIDNKYEFHNYKRNYITI